MKNYSAYLLDLDGTIYRGSEIIPEAIAFIQHLREVQIPFLYLTNNSSATPQAVADRLTGMGLPTNPEEVYTSSMATAAYLAERKSEGTPIYLIGESGIEEALKEKGFILTAEKPEYVVVGIDRKFTYEKLAIATTAIRNGATLIATNGDAALPTEKGLFPGNGSLVAAVSVASATQPIVIGKPESIIVEYALAVLGKTREETLIVGDNLHTDIEAGRKSGLDSLLVLTGYSCREDCEKHLITPTYIEESLLSWWDKARH
ncbi:TIGR01457 family HAD-type hydrolase [Brevibacillus sp. SYSU BS000544]|uniref:TIGR01457 family HAD-type hydrolase n=1 Tax=Brevibacillus sp. SYSU BS000544 TaxID=3416443 RepID=UPI003CE5344F